MRKFDHTSVSLLCYTNCTLNPCRNLEELVASPSCTKSFMSMWRCHQTTWIWYLQTDWFEELWRNRHWRSFAVPQPSSRNHLFPELSPNGTLFLIALPQQLRYLHSEASWALSHARRLAHRVAVISLCMEIGDYFPDPDQLQVQLLLVASIVDLRVFWQFTFTNVLYIIHV